MPFYWSNLRRITSTALYNHKDEFYCYLVIPFASKRRNMVLYKSWIKRRFYININYSNKIVALDLVERTACHSYTTIHNCPRKRSCPKSMYKRTTLVYMVLVLLCYYSHSFSSIPFYCFVILFLAGVFKNVLFASKNLHVWSYVALVHAVLVSKSS